MPPPEPVLIAALSGRALAASAARAGHRVALVDAFADADLPPHVAAARVPVDSSWRFDAEALVQAAECVAPLPSGLVYGSGFDRRPDLLGRLTFGRRLHGNAPERLAEVKDPFRFAEVARSLGIPHPVVGAAHPPEPRGWLIKARGGSGGSHIRIAGGGSSVGSGEYVQRRVPGRPVGVLVLADGRRATTLGFSEQWASPARGTAPFRFAGAAAPARLDGLLAADLARAAEDLVTAFGLIGAASVDALVDGDRYHVLEINPRLGATVDVFDRAFGLSLFDLHLRACRGELPGSPTPPRRAEASMVVFATTRALVGEQVAWPDWTADRPHPGELIRPSEPICTVFASGPSPRVARERAIARSALVPWLLRGRRPARSAMAQASSLASPQQRVPT